MTDYYRSLRSDYLTDPRLKPEHALVMNYLVAQAEGFEINRKHLNSVFAGRIGQDKLKATLKALGELGYITVQKSERTTGGKFTRKPATVNHSACVYRGQTEGVLAKRSVTERSVATPTTTTTNNQDEGRTYGVGATPSVELGRIEGRSASGSPATGSSAKADLPGSASSASSSPSTGSSSQGRSAVANGGTHAPLRLAAPTSSATQVAAPCPLGCGGTIPADAGIAWADNHVRTRHADQWDAWQQERAR